MMSRKIWYFLKESDYFDHFNLISCITAVIIIENKILELTYGELFYADSPHHHNLFLKRINDLKSKHCVKLNNLLHLSKERDERSYNMCQENYCIFRG